MDITREKRMMRSAALFLIALAMVLSTAVFFTDDVSAASKKPSKVKVTSMVKLNQMVTINWKKAKRAKTYQIYVKAGKSKWKKAATVKANGKAVQTYKVTRLNWNTTYKVRMRAVNGKKKGKWSTTYKWKPAKRTTLAACINSNPQCRKELARIGKEASAEGVSASVSATGNVLVMTMTMTNLNVPANDTAVRKQFQDEFTAEMKSANTKKAYMSSVRELELGVGIFGLRMRVIVRDKSGTVLANVLY